MNYYYLLGAGLLCSSTYFIDKQYLNNYLSNKFNDVMFKTYWNSLDLIIFFKKFKSNNNSNFKIISNKIIDTIDSNNKFELIYKYKNKEYILIYNEKNKDILQKLLNEDILNNNIPKEIISATLVHCDNGCYKRDDVTDLIKKYAGPLGDFYINHLNNHNYTFYFKYIKYPLWNENENNHPQLEIIDEECITQFYRYNDIIPKEN
jgi:hypothetical protein